ncbi:hypothetical protein HYALB_00013966 [Hymenoscyphus albidus]|uniref:Uncharacterized protein n=1 Tax=Hymenoscyphus albidus TaxID=595503 RepID=A0A9N9Q1A0_9HELO|nr:hypothetical protein HYALB_00013966 [Hymenoscyphus albidus]
MEVDPEKIRAIVEWKSPENVKDVQSFQGFANFCRQFIGNYAGLSKPLTDLTRKDKTFFWDKVTEQAFQEIKQRFAKEPILRNHDVDKPSTVETDASDTAVGAVHLQPDDNGKLMPVAYFSKTLDSAQQNYSIFEKELLAIVLALEHWKIYLQGAKHRVTILTDHENLKTFTTTKELSNRRLARWSQTLAGFDIVIRHVSGTSNARADALSRKPGYEGNKEYKKIAILKTLENGDLAPTIHEIAATTRESPWDGKIKAAQAKDEIEETKNGKIWVPDSYAKEFIAEYHAAPAHGHQGVRRTLQRIKRNYHVDRVAAVVKEVIAECDTCIRNKASRHAPYGQMGTTPIPPTPWKSISWDFIVKLPKSKDPMTGVEYDSILVIMERLTKYMILGSSLETWTTRRDNLRQRQALYLIVLESPHGALRSEKEAVNSLSPPDKWRERTHESSG